MAPIVESAVTSRPGPGPPYQAATMIAGLLDLRLVEPAQIVASHPRTERRDRLHERLGIETAESNVEAVTGADLVFLTIKPQVLSTVMRQLHGKLEPRQVAASVIAGASIATLDSR